MTASYIVRYHGSAPDKDGFIDHYRKSHAPILNEFPGIQSLVLHHAAGFNDPFPIAHGRNLLIAEMAFENIPALNYALSSPARTRARDDFTDFPQFIGDVTHQAFTSERMF